jgi:hydroxyethylthiazole kinase-like uncharacterized protein yjeF
MTELLTAAQMRAIEQAAIASGEVTGLELMERAGRGVVEAIFEEWPELRATSHRAVVLCGPGNNGGDGFVVARLLKEWGWEVEVFLYGDPSRLPPDARVNYERWRGMGEVKDIALVRSHIGPGMSEPPENVYIDALFGTGLSRPLPQDLWPVFRELNVDFQDYGVAIDIPSGICADSGRALGDEAVLPAPLTVTFRSEKIGHRLSLSWWRYKKGAKVRVVDIGLDYTHLGPDEHVVQLNDYWHSACNLTDPWWSKLQEKHKYSHGHALILSGPSGRGGAARLAARGALRIGAGVVTVGCPLDAIPEHAARLDAVMLRGVADGAALAEVLEDKRINALCLGPGMGVGTREAGLILAALEARRATVLDADALRTGFFDEADALFGKLHDHCVLTPHAGEFARLFPDISEKLAAPATKGPAYSKVDAAREAAARAGCVVLYKGPDTVIAGPDGRCAINSAHYDRAAPWLATAGSGDVLAGFISGLLARGFSPFDAACTGAWLHVECALSFGPGLIAEDLPEELPKVFRALGM